MHIPENYLSPATCAVMTAAMVPVWHHAIKRINTDIPKEKIPMIGVGAAFSFLGMMFNVPLLGGTTGHAVGGTLIALLFGPDAACLAVSIALLLQAVIFGDGGILSFGANCFNMAFVLPYVGYAIYKLIVRFNEKGQYVAAAIGSYIGINVAAFCAAVEFGIQPMLFKDAAGNALYCPYDLSVSIPAMMLSHLAVAGVVEAVFTVAIFAFVRKMAPDLIVGDVKTESKKPIPVFALIAVLVAATPLGLLATGTAWGEWGAEELLEQGLSPAGITEGWSLETIMPDYGLSGMGEIPAYILSAIIGVALLIIIFKLLAVVMKGKEEEYAS